MEKALVVIDFINEIVDDKGKLAAKGYASFIKHRNVFERLNEAIGVFRAEGFPIVFVCLAFDPSYANQPKSSPVLGRAHEFGILKEGEWSTEIHPAVRRNDNDLLITKQRINAFHNTALGDVLKSMNVAEVYIAGVATDLAVESTARDAHDRDFAVSVIADACVAATDDDHEKSIRFLSKIAKVINASELRL